MNVDDLQRKLIAAARENPPGDRVPYAFERRIMAHISSRPLPDRWAQWAAALWRGAAACVAITLLLSAWSYYSASSTASTTDVSQQIENTLLAGIDQDQQTDMVQ
jgi:hypothetical protein